jgi:hypothetical protein
MSARPAAMAADSVSSNPHACTGRRDSIRKAFERFPHPVLSRRCSAGKAAVFCSRQFVSSLVSIPTVQMKLAIGSCAFLQRLDVFSEFSFSVIPSFPIFMIRFGSNAFLIFSRTLNASPYCSSYAAQAECRFHGARSTRRRFLESPLLPAAQILLFSSMPLHVCRRIFDDEVGYTDAPSHTSARNARRI